jgi:hypothetical protein
VEHEKNDPKYGRELRILRDVYSFKTTTNMPRHCCLDRPVEPRDVERNASIGYCPIHRHPLYVEFIESLSVLLISVLRMALNAVDLPSARTAMQKDMSIRRPPHVPGEAQPRPSSLDQLFTRIIVEPLEMLTMGKLWMMDWDDDGNVIEHDNLACQGCISVLVQYSLYRMPPGRHCDICH